MSMYHTCITLEYSEMRNSKRRLRTQADSLLQQRQLICREMTGQREVVLGFWGQQTVGRQMYGTLMVARKRLSIRLVTKTPLHPPQAWGLRLFHGINLCPSGWRGEEAIFETMWLAFR